MDSGMGRSGATILSAQASTLLDRELACRFRLVDEATGLLDADAVLLGEKLDLVVLAGCNAVAVPSVNFLSSAMVVLLFGHQQQWLWSVP